MERLFYQYWIYGSSSFSAMMSALFSTLQVHGLRMRRELTLAVKAMTQSEELMRAIAPGMPLVQVAAEEAERLLREQLTPERIGKVLRGELAQVVQGAVGQASSLQQDLVPAILAALTGGQLGLGAAPPDRIDLAPLEARIDRVGRSLDRQGHRLAMIVGLAGLGVGMSVAMLALFVRPPGEASGVEVAVAALVTLSLAVLALTIWRGRPASEPTPSDRDRDDRM